MENDMKIGVDYYPEHWDEELWEKDADLMRETGVSLVRMAEFSWCRLEPRDGEFDFDWLDRAIDIFTQRNIEVVLCTPTNCPPLWLYEKYPDSVQTGKDGNKIATGIRGHRCYNHPELLRYSDRIVEIMAKRYANNKAVVAWQIDNELEANFCFCPRCIEEYRSWLKEKHGSLAELNRAYGNVVWSGEYSSWEQVRPPFGSYPQAWLNPAYMLDFRRYASDNMIKYIDRQAAIIRRFLPDAKITANVWFCENTPDFHKEFKGLDFVSYDNYPTTSIPDDPEEIYSHAFHLDLMRGVKRKKFWIMEQLSGGLGCWAPMSKAPAPGMIEGYSLQAMAHGADTVLHFRWRTAVSGAEMHWHGLIDHSNVPGRRFEEFARLCKRVKELDHSDGMEIKSEAAILYSAENEWAFKIQPQTYGMDYWGQLKLLHNAFVKCGLNADIISECESLENYKIIAAPAMYVTDPAAADKLNKFAKNGGTVILTNRSGVKDENNNCIMSPLPTVYRELVGAYVEEYDPIGGAHNRVRLDDGEEYGCTHWCDILVPETAEIAARYAEDFYSGKPAVTVNKCADGKAYYIGTVCEKAFYYRLIKNILEDMGISYCKDLPDGVEVTVHTGEKNSVVFIFNNTSKRQEFVYEGRQITLEPFEMLIERV